MINNIPSDRGIDNTVLLLREGDRFILNRCERYQSDIFQTRLLFQKSICFKGEAAAQVFYDTEKFSRHNGAPKRLKKNTAR